MKKLFTLLTLLLCAVVGANAEEFFIKFQNSKSITESPAGYFTYNKGEGTAVSWSSKGKHKCTYNGESYSDVIKMESATQAYFTSSAEATVTIVQTTSNATGDKLKFDGSNLDATLPNTTVTVDADNTCNIYVITNVAAGKHTITRQSETGLAYIKVEYTGAVLTQLAAPSITFDATSGEVTIGAVANATKVTYTTDGTDPTDVSTEYTAPFTVTDGTVVKAIAIGDQTSYSNSDIASKTVLLENTTIETPVINQFNGTVAITCATANTTIKYSIDGGATYQDYTRAFTLSADAEVKAKAIRGTNESEVATANVTVVPTNPATTKTILMGFGSFTVDSSKKYIMTGNAGDSAEGYTLTIDNTSKGWSELTDTKLTMTQHGNVERTAIKLSNGAKNILTLPEGVKATRITIYSVINSAVGRTSYWKEFNGEAIAGENVPMGAWNDVTDRKANPDVRVFPLTGEETEITFTNAGEQLGFVIALDVVEPQEEQITIGTAGYATFSNANEVEIPEGVTAYYAQLKDASTITLKEIAGNYIPANTGVVVSGSEGTYNAAVTTTGATLTATNLLKPWLSAGVPTESEYYTLAAGPCFKKSSGGTLAAGKAYLVLPEESSARELKVTFGDETTSISTLSATDSSDEIYNLQGQRLTAPQKGLYIVNGKKYMVK